MHFIISCIYKFPCMMYAGKKLQLSKLKLFLFPHALKEKGSL